MTRITPEHVLQLAPDEASLTAGKKLQAGNNWQHLGRNEHVIWGECQGSSLYQVQIDFNSLDYQCSCPSRKLPCKHVLGLLLLAVNNPESVLNVDTPYWVNEWFATRLHAHSNKEKKSTLRSKQSVEILQQKKRVEKRHDRVYEGLCRFDLWMKDLIRTGLAGLETKGPAPWEEQARRLVDAQMPALANRVRHLGELQGSSPQWPSHLLSELGKIKWAIHAFQRCDQLDPNLFSELRQWIGWPVTSAELEQVGEKVVDDWLLMGQWTEDDDRLRTQRTWCLGEKTRRLALVLQYAPKSALFARHFTVGSVQKGTMLYYPGVSRLRAQFVHREEQSKPIQGALPGHACIDSFLDSVARELALHPWMSFHGCVLNRVAVTRQQDRWMICDQQDRALPLAGHAPWKLLALTGGTSFDLVGEWNGLLLRPLGAMIDGKYRLC